MNELESMRVFLRVAELSSFTAAAAALGMPRASVSTAVQRLEERVHARLLHRTTRRVRLTQDGEVFAERARDLVGDFDELTQLFDEQGPAVRGRLRVDMPLGVSRVVLPRLGELFAAHPELQVELSSTDRYVDVVREGFDCVVRVGPRGDSALIARPIGSYAMVNCASPAYLARYGTPAGVEDLPGHRLVHYASVLGQGTSTFEYLDPSTGGEAEVAMPWALAVSSSDAYLAACHAGFGLIQVPLAGVRADLERGALVEVLPAYRPAPLPLAFLFPHRRHLPRRVRVFMDFVAAIVRPTTIEGGLRGTRRFARRPGRSRPAASVPRGR
ncbi:MAG: LysR family transcriptional regulator [Polyangiales bacterium]